MVCEVTPDLSEPELTQGWGSKKADETTMVKTIHHTCSFVHRIRRNRYWMGLDADRLLWGRVSRLPTANRAMGRWNLNTNRNFCSQRVDRARMRWFGPKTGADAEEHQAAVI